MKRTGKRIMREPELHHEVFGIMAEFDRPEALLEAVGRAREAGFRSMDAYSPFPIEGIDEALSFHDNRIPILALIGGVLGAATGYGMQVYANLDYPLNIGGRPLIAWQAFMLITFEVMVLFSVGFTIVGMLLLNRLPRLNHPVFNVESFHLASSDKFFLVIFSNDIRFVPGETRLFLEGLSPVRIDEIGKTEEPE